jgi:hypothetical protein
MRRNIHYKVDTIEKACLKIMSSKITLKHITFEHDDRHRNIDWSEYLGPVTSDGASNDHRIFEIWKYDHRASHNLFQWSVSWLTWRFEGIKRLPIELRTTIFEIWLS